MNRRFFSVSPFFDQPKALLIAPGIFLFFSFFDQVKRRSGNIKVALLNDLFHVPEKERHDQRINVASVYIGVGHDNDLMIAEFLRVNGFGVFLRTHGDTKCGKDIPDFFALEHPVLHRFFHVQDLTAQGQDGLETAVSALFGGAAGRISLNQVDFALRRIPFGAVGKFPGQPSAR